jgi:hypothetical protein
MTTYENISRAAAFMKEETDSLRARMGKTPNAAQESKLDHFRNVIACLEHAKALAKRTAA